MNIILKHTFRSATQHKVQVAIIITTIALATVMIFAGFSMSDVFYNINITEYDRVAQGADMLLGENNGTSETFSKARVEAILSEYPEEIASVEYFLKLPTIMTTEEASITVLVEATDLEEYLSVHELNYIDMYEGDSDNPYGADVTNEYYPMIIGETFAENNDLSVGDTAQVYLAEYDIYSTLFVMYIAEDEGIFSSSVNINILVDFSAVTNYQQVNAVYITFTDSEYYEKYEEMFAEYLPAIEVAEGNNESRVLEIVSQNTLLLSVAIVFIVIAMMLILLTSYLIIARNRMSEMIIFKAAGATPKQVAGIMILEVLLYAIVGSVLGVVLCRLMLAVGIMVLLPYTVGLFSYAWWQYALSIIIAIVVTVCATLVPITQASKKTIRESLSNESKAEVGKGKPILAIVSVCVALIAGITINFVSGIFAYILSAVMVLSACAIVAFCGKYVLKFWAKVWAKINKNGAKALASVTALRSKAIHTITVLLAIVVAFSFVVVEVVDLVKVAITSSSSRYEADYIALVGDTYVKSTLDIAMLTLTTTQSDITGAGYYTEISFTETEDDTTTFRVFGASSYNTVLMCTDLTEDVYDLWLSETNPAILSTDMMLRLNCKVGDTIELYVNLSDYEGETVVFTVIGEDTTTTENDRVIFTRYDTVSDYATSSVILIDGSGNEEFSDVRDWIAALNLNNTYVLTVDAWSNSGSDLYSGVAALLTMLQYAMYAICMLGLLNIIIVTMIDRKQEFMLYSLCGMDNKNYKQFSIGEASIVALSGGTLGMVAGIGIAQILPTVATIINKYMSFSVVPLATVVVAVIGGLGLLLSWSLLCKMRKPQKMTSINDRFKV
ncbi:MAG: ABC transporter permease [Bacillota bacterium]